MAADRFGSKRPADLVIALKGGGDLATGVALTLYRAGLGQIYVMETCDPTVIRRRAALASALFDGEIRVEGVRAVQVTGPGEIRAAWQRREIPVLADPAWQILEALAPDVLVDGIMAKKNLGTAISHAPLVLGLGPGFTAGRDAHLVIETRRGHDLGRLISQGSAAPNTSRPEPVLGIGKDRLVRAPATGRFDAAVPIGESVVPGQVLGRVGEQDVLAAIGGVIRGLIRDGHPVRQGQKIGDVDPRGEALYCHTCSDKARALGGAVLTAVLGAFHG